MTKQHVIYFALVLLASMTAVTSAAGGGSLMQAKVCGWEQTCSFSCNVVGLNLAREANEDLPDASTFAEHPENEVSFDFDVQSKCGTPSKALFLLELSNSGASEQLRKSPLALFVQDRSTGKIDNVITPRSDSAAVRGLKVGIVRVLASPVVNTGSRSHYAGKDGFGSYRAHQIVSTLGRVGYAVQDRRVYTATNSNNNKQFERDMDADLDEQGAMSAVKESWKGDHYIEELELPLGMDVEIQRISTRTSSMCSQHLSDDDMNALIQMHVGDDATSSSSSTGELDLEESDSYESPAVLEAERQFDKKLEKQGEAMEHKALKVWKDADVMDRETAAKLAAAENQEKQAKLAVDEFSKVAQVGKRAVEGLRNNWGRLQRDGEHARDKFKVVGGADDAFRRARKSAAFARKNAEYAFYKMQQEAKDAMQEGEDGDDDMRYGKVDYEAAKNAKLDNFV